LDLDYPFKFDGRGRTTATGYEDHVRDLIEQVLFTTPGERVNRPTFGCGLLQLVFAPNGDALAAATQLTVQAALQQWLGDVIEVAGVEVQNVEATLRVAITYSLRGTAAARTEVFTAGGAP
jgi:phage baseplate assembly protein W